MKQTVRTTLPLLTATLALLLSGCTPGPPDPNGAPSQTPVGNGGEMSRLLLESYSLATTGQVLKTMAHFAGAEGYDEVGGPPLMGYLGGIGTLSTGSVKAQQQAMARVQEQQRTLRAQGISVTPQDCQTYTDDDTDSDWDGIADLSQSEYHCEGQLSGFGYAYDGVWGLEDRLQGDRATDYRYAGNSLGQYVISYNGLDYDWDYAVKESLDAVPNEGRQLARYLFNWDAVAAAGVFGVGVSLEMKSRLDLSMERQNDSSGQGWTVSMQGVGSATSTRDVLSGSTRLSAELHYNAVCGDFDRGTLRFFTGKDEVTVTYTGCGEYE